MWPSTENKLKIERLSRRRHAAAVHAGFAQMAGLLAFVVDSPQAIRPPVVTSGTELADGKAV